MAKKKSYYISIAKANKILKTKGEKEDQKEVAKRFNVSQATVSKIYRGTWNYQSHKEGYEDQDLEEIEPRRCGECRAIIITRKCLSCKINALKPKTVVTFEFPGQAFEDGE